MQFLITRHCAHAQMEVEWQALEVELSRELSDLRLEEDRMDVIKQQQMELLLEAAREKEEVLFV